MLNQGDWCRSICAHFEFLLSKQPPLPLPLSSGFQSAVVSTKLFLRRIFWKKVVKLIGSSYVGVVSLVREDRPVWTKRLHSGSNSPKNQADRVRVHDVTETVSHFQIHVKLAT